MMNRKLFSAVVIFFLSGLFYGCASAPVVKEHQDEPVVSASVITEEKTVRRNQDVVNSIDIINMRKGCRVRINASKQPAYTVFKLSDPDRLIVDVSDMAQGMYQSLKSVQNDHITVVRSSEMSHQGREFLRIEIGLQADFDYNAFNMGNVVYVDLYGGVEQTAQLPQSEDVPQAEKKDNTPVVIVDLRSVSTPSEDRITLVSQSGFKDFTSFTLTQPNRIVVDFPGAREQVASKRVDVGSDRVDRVRIGGEPEAVRLVVDLAGRDFPLYHIDQDGEVINIYIKEKGVENAQLPDALLQEIPDMYELAEEAPQRYTGDRISLDFKDADIKNVLRLISEISGLNMIIGDAVQGRVTLKLDNIPWDEAFDIILDTNNLGKIETPNVIHIETKANIKRIQEERILARRIEQDIEDLLIHSIDVSYARAADIVRFVRELNVLTNRGSVTSFAHNNRVTIQEVPSNMQRIIMLVEKQDMPTRQVLIEARVVQSNPNYTREIGIQWGGTYRTTMDGGVDRGGSDIELRGPQTGDWAVNLPAAIGEGLGGGMAFGYIRDTYRLNLQLSALEKEDKIKIVSHPKILGLNNQEARIKQGVALPYLKLNPEGVTSTEFKDAVLELRVTPTITPANTVNLDIFVTKNQRSALTGAGNEPGIDVREVETQLLVADGNTIVIGGIYETTESISINKVPFLGNIPFAGRLFKSEKTDEQIQEMLVFITVTIVEDAEETQQASMTVL